MVDSTKFVALPSFSSDTACWLSLCGEHTFRITVGGPPAPLELVHTDCYAPSIQEPFCVIHGAGALQYNHTQTDLEFLVQNRLVCTLDSPHFIDKDDPLWDWDGGSPVYQKAENSGAVWDCFPRITVTNFQPHPGATTKEGEIRLQFPEPVSLHGLGQHEKGIFDYRNTHQYLYHTLMKTPMPFLAFGNGCGLLLDCGCLLEFNSTGSEVRFRLDSVDRLELFFLLTPCMDELIKELRRLTGAASMLPRWALGYIFSKERFHTRQELLETANLFRQKGIPCDCLVQDWRSWIEPLWGNKHFDQVRFPDMKQAIATLHQQHFRYMIAVWPNAFVGSSDHQEMAEKGYLLGDYLTYDAFNPDARKTYGQQCAEYEEAGADALWADATEPFQDFEPSKETRLGDFVRAEIIGAAHKRFLGSRRANLYSLYHCRGLYTHWLQKRPNQRPVLLTRSVYPSEQAFGVIHWSGDISATWQTYREQLAELLNMNICGIPYLSEDIGGFAVGRKQPPVWCWAGDFQKGMQDLGYRELYVRWMQNGALLPIFRSHGTDTPREPWACESTQKIPFFEALLDAIRLRYRLLPYLYTLMAATAQQGDSMMRALCFDYPNDPIAANMSTEYLLGHNLLVCPVLEPFYYAPDSKPLNKTPVWPCYLPAGNDFYNWHTGMHFTGGQTVRIPAPIHQIPLFVKAGSIIVLANEDMQSTDDFDSSILTVHIYAGRDGSYTLYDDEGDGQNWKDGAFCLTKFRWQDKAHLLTIEKRQGSWPGMPCEQQFQLHLFTPTETFCKNIRYTGSTCIVQF